MSQRIELERHFTVGRNALQSALKVAFKDNRIDVRQHGENSEGEEQLHLKVTSQFGRLLAELPIKEHLGGGAKPMVKLEDHFNLHSKKHNNFDAEAIISKTIKACHIH